MREPSPPSNLFDSMEIASPCPASWADMAGNDAVRFCNLCQLNVYNLSGLTRLEAETLFQAKEGKMCIRMFKRADGTVLTKDCPVGVRAKYKRRIRATGWRVAAAAVMVVALYGTFTPVGYGEGTSRPDNVELGKPVARPTMGTPPVAPQGVKPPEKTPQEFMVGKMRIPEKDPVKDPVKKPCETQKDHPKTDKKTTQEQH